MAQVEVHVAFVALWAYWLLSSLWAGQESWSDIFFLDAILYGPILLVTLLVHGLVHAYTALHYGRLGSRRNMQSKNLCLHRPVPLTLSFSPNTTEASGPKITIWPFLFFIDFEENPKDATRLTDDLILQAAGPSSHLVMLFFWGVLTLVSKARIALSYASYHDASLPWGSKLCLGATLLNFFLLLLNLLLPAWPLPGGCILANLLVQCGASLTRAAAWTAKATQGTAILVILYAVYTYLHHGDGLLAILLAVWLYYRSQELQVQGSNHALFQKPCFQGTHTQSLLGGDAGRLGDAAVDPSQWTSLGPQSTGAPEAAGWKDTFSSMFGSQPSHTRLPTDENGLGI